MANPFSINFNTPDTRGIFDANEGRKLADRESIQTAMKDLTSMALESRLAKDESMTPTQKAQERFKIYSGFGDTQRAAAAKSDLRLEEQRALDRSRLLEGRAYAEGQAELTRQRALKTAALDLAVKSYQSITTRLDGLLEQRTTLAGDGEFAMSDAIKEQMQRLDTTIDALRVKQRELYGRFSADLQGQLVAPLDMAASPTSQEVVSAVPDAATSIPTTESSSASGNQTTLDGNTSGVLETVDRVAQSLVGRNDSSGTSGNGAVRVIGGAVADTVLDMMQKVPGAPSEFFTGNSGENGLPFAADPDFAPRGLANELSFAQDPAGYAQDQEEYGEIAAALGMAPFAVMGIVASANAGPAIIRYSFGKVSKVLRNKLEKIKGKKEQATRRQKLIEDDLNNIYAQLQNPNISNTARRVLNERLQDHAKYSKLWELKNSANRKVSPNRVSPMKIKGEGFLEGVLKPPQRVSDPTLRDIGLGYISDVKDWDLLA